VPLSGRSRASVRAGDALLAARAANRGSRAPASGAAESPEQRAEAQLDGHQAQQEAGAVAPQLEP
jgi:hypothetical protein